MRTWIKFCGCTSWSDVEAAIAAGADAVGMIFADSPRRIAPQAAADIAGRVPPEVQPVSVFVDPAPSEVAAAQRLFPTGLVQFSGREGSDIVDAAGERAIKAVRVSPRDAPADLARACERYAHGLILFDTARDGLAGGTGNTFAWDVVEPIARRRRVVIAGGLTAGNVGACVTAIRPYGVDVRSGIETGDRKDPEKMRAFVRAVRQADAAG